MKLFVHRATAYAAAPRDTKLLKEELKRHIDTPFRRVSKFVLLALIGACSCADGSPLPQHTAVYLTTENGNLADTESVLSQIYRRHSLPMPFNFINTMANTAAFYIAQALGLCSRNITLASQNLSFERGLEVLKTDMALGTVRTALIGTVDEATASPAPFETASGTWNSGLNEIDRSCWLLVTSESDGAIGAVTAIRSFRERDGALRWLEENPDPLPPHTYVSFGLAIAPTEKKLWLARLQAMTSRPVREFDYTGDAGRLNVTTACGVSRFLNHFKASELLHLNRDFSGQHVLLQVSSF